MKIKLTEYEGSVKSQMKIKLTEYEGSVKSQMIVSFLVILSLSDRIFHIESEGHSF